MKMKNKKQELTDETIERMEIDENGLSYKNITLTNRQVYELCYFSDELKKAGLNISPSNLIRLCLDHSLEKVKQKMFLAAGLTEHPAY